MLRRLRTINDKLFWTVCTLLVLSSAVYRIALFYSPQTSKPPLHRVIAAGYAMFQDWQNKRETSNDAFRIVNFADHRMECEHRSADCCMGKDNDVVSVLERVAQRIECRMLTPKPKLSPVSPPKSQQASFHVTHNLTCIGRLGNQLFALAATIGIGHRTDRTAIFPDEASRQFTSFFKNPFPVERKTTHSPAAECPEDRFVGIFNVSQFQLLAIRNNPTPRVTVRGYLHSWKYFDGIASLIKWQMVFSSSVYGHALAAIKENVSKFTSTTGVTPESIIGLHVRRGDFLSVENLEFGHMVAPDDYIRKTLTKVNNTHPRSVFAVVTDDPAYCRELFGMHWNVMFLDDNSPQVDLAILTLMDHLIITVGTFGWWGAYLSDAKEVYYYKRWPKPNSKMAKRYHIEDYFLPHWKGEL